MKILTLAVCSAFLLSAHTGFADVYQADLRQELDGSYLQDKVTGILDTDLSIREDLGESWLHGSKQKELDVVRETVNQLGKLMLGLYVTNDSPALVTNISNEITEGRQEYRIMRDAHPKAHQCVNAKFTVEDNAFFPTGSFLGDPIEHDAIVRFSSAAPSPDSDAVNMVRGAAIKVLMGEQTHDFVMMSIPNFPTDNIEQFSNLIKVGRVQNCMSIIPDPDIHSFLGPLFDFAYQINQATQCLIESDFNLLHLPETIASISRFREAGETAEIKSVFDYDFFGVSPYAYQDTVFKYEVSPTECAEANPQDRSFTSNEATHSEGLKMNIERVLSTGPACYDLNVVARPSDLTDHQAIESLIKTWDEMSSQPLERIKVASVVIPQISPDTGISSLACDEMQNNNGHYAEGFKPLGSINRGRIPIYSALSAFRLEVNDHLRQ